MKKTIISSLLAIAAAAPIASYAVDGTITFNGSVTGSTCVINGGGAGAGDFTVTMAPVPTSALASAGQTAGNNPAAIRIALTNCAPASGNVRAFFEGGATVDPTTHALRNTSAGTPATGSNPAVPAATNVQIRLFDKISGTDLNLDAVRGSQFASSVAISSAGAATLEYGTKYLATGSATAGPVRSTIQYTLDFH